MPKGYKKHPVTGQIVNAGTKVDVDYDQLINEYYKSIENGVLITIETYAELKGLSKPQIGYITYEYLKKYPDFWEKVLNLSRTKYHKTSIEIDTALVKKCQEGDPRAIKLYYERIEGWISQISQPSVNIQLIFNNDMISDDEKNIVELKQVDKPQIECDKSEIPLLMDENDK